MPRLKTGAMSPSWKSESAARRVFRPTRLPLNPQLPAAVGEVPKMNKRKWLCIAENG